MGYGYAGNRLACANCNTTTGTRKRKCPHTVTDEYGRSLPWRPAPALCTTCYKRNGGLRGVHGDTCKTGAATAQATADHIRARLAVGDMKVTSAWGDWHRDVPTGQVAVLFRAGTRETWRLVADGTYDPQVRGFLSDYPTAQPCPRPGS